MQCYDYSISNLEHGTMISSHKAELTQVFALQYSGKICIELSFCKGLEPLISRWMVC